MKTKDAATKEALARYDTLQKIVDQLRAANYCNEQGCLICNVAFLRLEQLAELEQQTLNISG